MNPSDDIRISPILIWLILLPSLVLSTIIAYMAHIHSPFSTVFTLIAITFTLSMVLDMILIYDIVINKIPNRAFWIMSLFFMNQIGAIVYMLRRKKLLTTDSIRRAGWHR